MNLGLSKTDAQAYIYLAKKGPQTGENIAYALNINNQQAYRCLKHLQTKGVANAAQTHSVCFSAVPFEKVIDTLVKTKRNHAQNIQQNKKEILSIWESLILDSSTRT
jgi:sugar-specific transcriptional regulator TrmB